MAIIPWLLEAPATACPFQLPTTTISVNGNPLVVELAVTPRARNCGLSHRALLGTDRGMLFVYPNSRPLSFWMKETHIPLSIAFLDGSGIVINIENMVPDQINARYRSRLPAVFALEVNRGWFHLHGVKPGDRVEIKLPASADGPPCDPFTAPCNPSPSPPTRPHR